MKQAALVTLLMAMVVLCGCSIPPIGTSAGIGVMFEGEPLIFDSSVVYMGTVVGQVLSSEWGNGVTRVTIAPDGRYDDLKKTNLVAVVRNGRLHLDTLGGYGDPLPPSACISGFEKPYLYHWFKFKHLINNMMMAADQRARRLRVRSGLAG